MATDAGCGGSGAGSDKGTAGDGGRAGRAGSAGTLGGGAAGDGSPSNGGAGGTGGIAGPAGRGGGVAGNAGREGSATDAGAAGPPATAATDGGTWRLVWSDEFDVDGTPNAASWGYERGFVRNEELQWYQPDNAKVANGLLTISAQKVHVANPNYVSGSSSWKTNRQYYDYTSTSMTTSGKRSWQYGRFEMRARIDTRQGSWPAFWMLGNGTSWPSSGEVDIMEYYASKVLANVCKPAGSDCNWASTSKQLSALGSAWSSQFHVWAMEWDASRIDLYLDDSLVNHFDVSTAVSSGSNPYTARPFYVVINLAIGASGGDPSKTTFPITYDIDYVRVYQR